MKIFRSILASLLSVTLFVCLSVQGSTSTRHITKYYQGSKIEIIITNMPSISVQNTQGGHFATINCSFFNLNTMQPVKVNAYGRPFIIFKKDGSIVISDNVADLVNIKQVASAGSWLIKDNKSYSTNDHFSKAFKNAVVNRSAIGIDRNSNVLLVVIKKASLYKATQIMKMLGAEYAVNLDGGSSSQMKYDGKMIVTGRHVSNYIVVN